mgnify:CR=1 FL=1
MRTYEDFTEGLEIDLGPYPVTRDEVIEFAREFDPQPFHLDEEAAKDTLLGGLSASGFFTVPPASCRAACPPSVRPSASSRSPRICATRPAKRFWKAPTPCSF